MDLPFTFTQGMAISLNSFSWYFVCEAAVIGSTSQECHRHELARNRSRVGGDGCSTFVRSMVSLRGQNSQNGWSLPEDYSVVAT